MSQNRHMTHAYNYSEFFMIHEWIWWRGKSLTNGWNQTTHPFMYEPRMGSAYARMDTAWAVHMHHQRWSMHALAPGPSEHTCTMHQSYFTSVQWLTTKQKPRMHEAPFSNDASICTTWPKGMHALFLGACTTPPILYTGYIGTCVPITIRPREKKP